MPSSRCELQAIGFLLSSLGDSQLSYHLTREAGRLFERGGGPDVVAFVQNVARPWRLAVPFPVMNVAEAYSFHGPTVATTLHTAVQSLACPGPTRRYFYIWDLEWISCPGVRFEEMAGVYGDPRLRLLARCDDHAGLIGRLWNRPVRAIVENCDFSALMKVIGEDAEKS